MKIELNQLIKQMSARRCARHRRKKSSVTNHLFQQMFPSTCRAQISAGCFSGFTVLSNSIYRNCLET